MDGYGWWHNELLINLADTVERQANERTTLANDVELDEPEEHINVNDNEKLKVFRKELEVLLNCHSIDSDLNTPDFILAEYIIKCLTNLKITTIDRDTWFGR